MGTCYYSRRRLNNFCCIGLMVYALFAAGIDIYWNIVDLRKTGVEFVDIGLWLISFCLIKASVFYYLIFSSRAYKVMEKGIFIRNFKRKVIEYSWDEISEISICDVHHASKSLYHEKVIRVVIGNEKNGPSNLKCPCNLLNGRERWRNASYGLRHYKKIILIEYSEERLNQIQTVSKKEIKDYRTRAWKD